MKISSVAKTIVAGVFAVLSVVAPVISGNDYLDSTSIIQMVLAVLTALGVFVVPNSPQTPVPQPVVNPDVQS